VKVETIQIMWHMREPVLSCDFAPNTDATSALRFATAGSDKTVKLWRLVPPTSSNNNEPMRVAFLASLERHALPVNVVRFSPDGSRIASASDDGYVMVWQKNANDVSAAPVDALEQGSSSAAATTVAASSPKSASTTTTTSTNTVTSTNNVRDDDGALESWSVQTVLRATQSIYDLAWSPSGDCIAVGCIDHKTIVWELATGRELLASRDHQHYVQGVAWDPASRFIATQSADRSLFLYDAQSSVAAAKEPPTGSVTKAQIKPMTFPLVRKLHDWHGETYNAPLADAATTSSGTSVAEPTLGDKKRRLFLAEHDNISFFRRLTFTPDASLLLVPTGVAPRSSKGATAAAVAAMAESETTDESSFCIQVFKTSAPRNPVAHLPFPNHPPVVVRACPALMALRAAPSDNAQAPPPSVFDLPHRMLFAAAALDEVVIYDTQQQVPLAVLRGLHYSSIHDMAWSNDGRYLLFASADGYCSVVTLSDAERGELLPVGAVDAALAERLAQAKVSALAQQKRWREERRVFLLAKRAEKGAAGEEMGADLAAELEDTTTTASATIASPIAQKEETTATAMATDNTERSPNAEVDETSEPTDVAVVQPQKRRIVLMDA
jgi:chromatin assembly factor 1 subunit B